jgi:class 3 adenylate cyclase
MLNYMAQARNSQGSAYYIKGNHPYALEYFTKCLRIGVQKIKTIGDAYMCVGGLPNPNSSHASDVVRMALAIRDFMIAYKQERQEAGLPFFEIRLGIHTGPVVAGIVGSRKFAYDVWGDTVNTAARMESSGEVGKVNISENTYQLVSDQFLSDFRGEIPAKNKGKLKMYFVEASSLS